MLARKWLSNSAKLLKEIPIQDRASEVEIGKDPLPTVKTLGVTWLPKKMCLHLKQILLKVALSLPREIS